MLMREQFVRHYLTMDLQGRRYVDIRVIDIYKLTGMQVTKSAIERNE